MPIQTDVFHFDRLVVAIGKGVVTLAEYGTFVTDVIQQGLIHYRKIIDVTRAESSALDPNMLMNFEERLREVGKLRRGPLAIVVPWDRTEGAQWFKSMTVTDRPIEVFRSIHDARGWVMGKPIGEPFVMPKIDKPIVPEGEEREL